ncbi:MAG: DUF2779 domain-containing protein [Polaromonas sp.]|uniref:DUF2779 domain-containing protein n=1 Tax=Polaromonas sp. TaxID=1869339 RepID=UPI0025D47E5E|nr:DUF2779 domain-containing protein [Polaromonas sp.]MBI2725549.1 DUF2779 domain-containing protein [Polaromonas sp.]
MVRADLLLPDAGQYRMAEVKSSTGVKDYHQADAAVQTWVARGSGLDLSRVEIAHINRSFVYQGGNDYRGLLHHADITEQIRPLEQQVPDWIAAARATLAGNEPNLAPGDQCHSPFECPFITYCSPQAVALTPAEDQFPIEILPYGGALAASLRSEGFVDLRDVPEARLSKPMHVRVWRATKHDTPELAPLAGEHVRALGYPRYYIDFETMQFVVPIWAGTSPYDQVPFQWSCHIEASKGSMTHTAFLADGSGDPRRPFAESLISTVGNAGAVIVYNAAFERTRLRELAESLPDLAPALNNIIERMFDLLPVARENYDHPDMRGSWSIKAVLPTIAPELAYDGLEVGNGGMAQEAFAEVLHADTPHHRRDQLRNALLIYCERDTLAMVKIAHYFENATAA